MPIGMKVTLRGERMYDFFDKLVNIILARVREFQGVPQDSFDGRGNYTLGMKEQIAFPEINYDQVDNRSYRTNGEKITKVLGFTPSVSAEEGVKEIVDVLRSNQYRDFDHPVYYNMRWMKLLVEVEDRLGKTGKVL